MGLMWISFTLVGEDGNSFICYFCDLIIRDFLGLLNTESTLETGSIPTISQGFYLKTGSV